VQFPGLFLVDRFEHEGQGIAHSAGFVEEPAAELREVGDDFFSD